MEDILLANNDGFLPEIMGAEKRKYDYKMKMNIRLKEFDEDIYLIY